MKKTLSTSSSKVVGAIRILISIPLIAISIQHLAGSAPIQPILQGAGIPFPELNATVAPIMEALAGGLLLLGLFGRVGALIALGSMSVATYTHVVFDWTDEPPIALPIAVAAGALLILALGSGAWSVDRRLSR